MSITDELREWAEGNTLLAGMSIRAARDQALAIADRIDAEHERAMAAAALIAGVPMTDEHMAEHGWVRGPLDADGEMWHSGDMSDSNWGVIEGIAYENGRWLVSGHDTSAPWVPADSIRHYHAPTVEDVLRECCHKYHSLLIDDMNDAISGVERDYIAPAEIIAEYAQRLQLREVDE